MAGLILVCGSRKWANESLISDVLEMLEPSEIIEGGAAGADRIAFEWACDHGIPVTTVEAEWGKYGRRAGPIRNKAMLDRNPDCVIAFWDGRSPGTKNMIGQAKSRGIKVEVHYDSEERASSSS